MQRFGTRTEHDMREIAIFHREARLKVGLLERILQIPAGSFESVTRRAIPVNPTRAHQPGDR